MVERRQAGLTKPEGQSSGKLSIQFGSLESHLNQVHQNEGEDKIEEIGFEALLAALSFIQNMTRVDWHWKDPDFFL